MKKLLKITIEKSYLLIGLASMLFFDNTVLQAQESSIIHNDIGQKISLYTNAHLEKPKDAESNAHLNRSTPSQECGRVFWSIDNSSVIREWFLDEQTISGGDVINTAPGFGIAFCGVGNQASFYADNFPAQGIAYFDESTQSWIDIPNDIPLLNNGGNGNDQYFQGLYDGEGTAMHHFDGETFTMIYYLDDSIFSVADIAVDSLGQAWAFTGELLEIMDTLMVINGQGDILRTFAMNQDPNTCYGSFFLEDQLYVGKEDSIFQVVLENDSAYFANPIYFPYDSYTDLAACHSNQLMVSVQEAQTMDNIKLYPNPADDYIVLESEQSIINLQCFNVQGQKYPVDWNDNAMNTAFLEPGLYVFKITTIVGDSYHRVLIE